MFMDLYTLLNAISIFGYILWKWFSSYISWFFNIYFIYYREIQTICKGRCYAYVRQFVGEDAIHMLDNLWGKMLYICPTICKGRYYTYVRQIIIADWHSNYKIKSCLLISKDSTINKCNMAGFQINQMLNQFSW